MTWMQTISGRAFDLLNPRAEDVDFADIAGHLARINRYCGASVHPVSVAQHTLIVAEACPDDHRPWALLHDAHEAYLGDWLTPVKWTLSEIACTGIDSADPDRFTSGEMVRLALRQMTRKVDAAIHAAAGLPVMAADKGRAILRRADLIALATERRDFLSLPPKNWGAGIESVRPLPRRQKPMSIGKAEEKLLAEFRRCLPALMA